MVMAVSSLSTQIDHNSKLASMFKISLPTKTKVMVLLLTHKVLKLDLPA
jgi:hypothetical protein